MSNFNAGTIVSHNHNDNTTHLDCLEKIDY